MKSNKVGWEQCGSKEFWADIASEDHVVQLYENDANLIGTLSEYAADGFSAGDSLIVIATPSHLSLLNTELERRGYDVPGLIAKDRYIPLDATDTLSRFMVNGAPDEQCFFETILPVMKRARKSGKQVRAFGEMVALLWESGQNKATIQLENLWNQFSKSEKFCLFCAYPKNGFQNDAGASVMHVCTTHNKVIGTDVDFPLNIHYQNVINVPVLPAQA